MKIAFKILSISIIGYFASQNLRSEKDFNDNTDPIFKINKISVIEGIPVTIDSRLDGSSFQWFKNGELLNWETNKLLTINFPLEGDEGNYFVRTSHKGISFQIFFNRNIKVLINDKEVSQDRIETDKPFTLKLIPYIEGLPIRYTLDGSEPNEASSLYENPIQVNNTVRLRAKIEIPETDSIFIQ